MENEPREQMNLERPSLLWYRVAGWVILIFSCWGIYELLTSEPDEFMSAGQNAVYTAAILAMACVSLMAIVVSHGVYYLWDSEKIIVSFLGRKRSVRWEEVDSIVARLSGDSVIYYLTDVRGQRLRVDMQVRRKMSPLCTLLREKWGVLVRDDLKDIEQSLEVRFPVRILGLPAGCFIVRGDKFIHKHGPRRRQLALTDIEEAYLRHERGEWPGAQYCELVSRTGPRIRIPPRTTRHDRLMAYVAAHAKNAVWVDLDGPEPNTSAAKAAYLRGAIESLRKPKATVLPFVSMMLYGAIDLVLRVDWIDAIWAGVSFSGGLAVLIWWFGGGSARRMRELQSRLAALEAEQGESTAGSDIGVGDE